MQIEVTAWCDGMLPHIRQLSPAAVARYCDSGRLPHYQAVAGRLADMKVEASIWQAGFLHGLHATLLDDLPGVSDETRRLVRARAALASLTSPVELTRNVLPQLDPKAALVLVIEQLHHVDPGHRLEEWAARFHVEPGELPAEVEVRPRYLGGRRWSSPEKYRDFLRTVVAPVARHIGLWNEADVLEDAAFLLEAPGRFRNIVAFARDASLPDGPSASRVSSVRRALGEGEHPATVRWEWRHVSRLDGKLPRTPWQSAPEAHPQTNDWLANLIHCGFATVVARDGAECWTLLGRLHQAVLRHRNDAFRDYLARPTRDGYQALHTEVTVALDGGGTAAVAVRLVPECADRRRFGPSDGAGVLAREGSEAYAPRAASEPMQVFAPDGRAVSLRPGSTVLNFAYKIHNHLPAFLRGAQVNRERVHVLKPLHPGDVVWLDVGDDPRPLPRGWELTVPRETVRPIRNGFMAAYRSSLRERGRTVLREHLVSQGAGTADDETLDEIVAAVTAALERQGHPRGDKDADWWYHQLGVNDAVERQELPARRDQRGHELLRTFLARAGQEMLLRRALHDLSYEGEKPEAKWCPRCSPGHQDALVFELKGAKLFVHRADASCAGHTFPLSLHFPPPQYITVLGDDRPGLAGDVLKVLYNNRLRIRRIDAVRRELGMGVIRVRLDPTTAEKIDHADAEIARLTGVRLVVKPGDPPPFEERILPARDKVAFRDVVLTPYVVGPPARGEAFYGMTPLIDDLHAALERVRGETAPSGGHVLLKGPKRTGKTSAVLKFRDDLPGRAITAYVEAGQGQDWQECEVRIMRELKKAAAAADGSSPGTFSGASLYELVLEVQDRVRLPVVLAFDEAMHMMAATHRAGRMDDLCTFASQARATPGLLTIWIGPESSRRLMTELDEILQSATPARVPDLTREEAAALLSAQQSDQCGRIEVENAVISRAYSHTKGNPFWLNALGKNLFENSHREADGVRRYDRPGLTACEPRILKEEGLFIDRYRQENPLGTEARIWELVLDHLAYPLDSGRHVEDEAALLRRVNEQLSITLDLPEWDDILTEMETRGTISRDGGSRCWIDLPLLAAHIRALADRRGKRWLR